MELQIPETSKYLTYVWLEFPKKRENSAREKSEAWSKYIPNSVKDTLLHSRISALAKQVRYEETQTLDHHRKEKPKDKGKILKAARKNNYKQWQKNGDYEDFSSKTMHAKRKWYKIFKVLKEKNSQPRISYPVKISFRNEGEIKPFSVYIDIVYKQTTA